MVGVPGRSKGCNTCIQRRIKCDQGRPTCGNCHRSKRVCGGYTRKTVYVFSEDVRLNNGDVGELGKDDNSVIYHGRSKVTDRQVQSTPSPNSSRPSPPRTTSLCPSFLIESTSTPHEETDDRKICPLFASPLTNISAVWQQMHSVFASAYLPKCNFDNFNDPYVDVSGYWVTELLDCVVDSPALQMAVAAFASSHIARENEDETLRQQSREMYMRGLNHLRTALTSKRTHLSDETLATCLVMAQYEMSESPAVTPDQLEKDIMLHDKNPYRTHLSGAIMIAEMRGPDANNSRLAHCLFQAIRRLMMLGSLMTYQPTFLSRPEWRDRPWVKFPKNNGDYCVDVVLDMPLLMQQYAAAVQETDQMAQLIELSRTLHRCSELAAVLQDWYTNFEQTYPQPMYWSTPSTFQSYLDNEDQGKVFPMSYQFATFRLAHLLITYWTGVMTLSKLTAAVNHRLAGLSCNSESGISCALAALDQQSNMMMGAIENLCQSAEFFLHPSTGRLGLGCANSFLQGCWSCLHNGPERWQRVQCWVEEIVGSMKGKMYLPARDYMRTQRKLIPD